MYVRFYSDFPIYEEGPILGPFTGLRIKGDKLQTDRGKLIAAFVVNSWVLPDLHEVYDNLSIIDPE